MCWWPFGVWSPPSGSRKVKTEPGARLALELHATAVQLDDAPGQRQAEPGALDLAGGGAVHLVELVEDALVVLAGDADAGVADLDAERVLASARALTQTRPPWAVNLMALLSRL